MKPLGTFLMAILILSGLASAQTEPVKPRTISGGVLNGKATSLPKPPYPPAARAVNAEGPVTVQVLIDEQGSVISANAVSGHPLLRAAAMEAAKGATFSPTLLQGEPVEVTGVITYNFVGTVTMASIGYEIAFAERSGAFTQYLHPRSLAARLPEDWADERSVLEGLTFEQSEVPAVKVEEAKTAIAESREGSKFTVIGDSSAIYKTGKLTSSSLESVRQLQQNVRAKLVADQKNEWHFRVGTTLGNFAAEISDSNKTSLNVAEIEQLAATAPGNSNPNIVAALTKLADLAKPRDGSTEARHLLVEAAQNVKNIRL